MRRAVVPLTLFVLAGAVPALSGRAGPQSARPQAAAKADAPSAEEAAVRAVDAAFVRDYNKADSKALASLFTEDVEVVDADGGRTRGRDLAEKDLAETFASNKGATIAFEIDAVRFLTADVAKEEGRSVVTPVKGAPVSRLYTVLYVKRDGRWLISSVREEADPRVAPHDRLKELEWMLGEWVDEDSDSVVRVDCKWSDDGHFLVRTFSVRREGKAVMSVTQRVGWDPLAKQFRSWEFDSEGGYGEGKWGRDGDRWVVKQTGVRPEGVTASATNVLTRERPDVVRWVSTDRVVGDESLPDSESYVLVRVPPRPGPKANTTRSPR